MPCLLNALPSECPVEGRPFSARVASIPGTVPAAAPSHRLQATQRAGRAGRTRPGMCFRCGCCRPPLLLPALLPPLLPAAAAPDALPAVAAQWLPASCTVPGFSCSLTPAPLPHPLTLAPCSPAPLLCSPRPPMHSHIHILSIYPRLADIYALLATSASLCPPACPPVWPPATAPLRPPFAPLQALHQKVLRAGDA